MNVTDTSHPFAVVTGASSGIGYELARQFSRHGYDVLIAAQYAGIDRAAADLRGDGTTISVVRTDLATHDGVERLYQAIQATGRPRKAESGEG